MHSTEHTLTNSGTPTVWRKSSYSGPANGECLEVADGYATVPIRDSKTPNGPTLVLSANGWTAFVSAVKNGSLNA
ncbi:DUF397 domain-containing protein [Streptomyces sp. PTD5-9]|uniref:DUF397 domain-containing protein n=1 Tax=Streptomyces sp. PTD5-9 TaxID=3120150 RepID=UPI003008E49E